MTLKQAEKATGLRIEAGSDAAGDYVTAYGSDGLQVKFMRAAKGVKEALGRLVDVLYKEECQRVFQKQNWRCARCSQIRPLQGHHVVHRSHGRVDKGNLEGLCVKCHGLEHGG